MEPLVGRNHAILLRTLASPLPQILLYACSGILQGCSLL